MNKQGENKIGWTDWTWNPIKGLCPINCFYCYARRLYKRFKWNPRLRFDDKELSAPLSIKKPSKIFVCSTMELFHPLIRNGWKKAIFEIIEQSKHTFQILTKLPERAPQFYPDNCWFGTTITGMADISNLYQLISHTTAKVRFVSFEPLLERMDINWLIPKGFEHLDWIVIGGLTPRPVHRKEWIDAIVNKADEHNIPVFIKDNANYPIKRKGFPNETHRTAD